MPAEPTCPNCRVEMDKGFIPDFTYGTSSHNVVQMVWHPGEPEDRKFLGLRTGDVKIDKSDAILITAYRCPDCGLLRAYAR